MMQADKVQAGPRGADGSDGGPLLRKLQRRVVDAEATGAAIAQAQRLALGRMARGLGDAPVAASAAQATRMSLGEVLDLAAPGMFVAILEDAQDRMGVALVDGDLAGALVEFLTSGSILPSAVPQRRPTRTDAALVCPAIDLALVQLDAALDPVPGAGWAQGFRSASFLEDPRPLGLVLEDCGYWVFGCDLAPSDAAAAHRGGRWWLVLPDGSTTLAPRAAGRAPDGAAPPSPGSQRAGAGWDAMLSAAVMGCRTELTAILGQHSMPLHAARALQPGDVLELPLAALESIAVVARDGTEVARARLGQARGNRALRLLQTSNDKPGDDSGFHAVEGSGGGGAISSLPGAVAPSAVGVVPLADPE